MRITLSGSGSNPASNSDISGSFPLTGTLTFNAGETTQTITVNVRGNTTVEADEEFTATISNASNDASIPTATAIGVIRNDDSQIRIPSMARPANGEVEDYRFVLAQPATFEIEPLAANQTEGDRNSKAFTFTITRTGATGVPMAGVQWSVTPAIPNPADGADFDFGGVLPGGTVNFGPGQTSTNITVPVRGDTTEEPNEHFRVMLSNPAFGAVIGAASAAPGLILNDDIAPAFITVTATTPTILEGNTGVTNLAFAISRSGNTNTFVGGTMVFRGGPANPVDALDLPQGIGLFPIGGSFSFDPGETNITLTFPILGDITHEPDETVELVITGVTGAQLIGSNAVATVINDDTAPDIQLRLLSFANGDARVEITGPAGMDVSLEVSADLATWAPVGIGQIAPNGMLILTEPGAQALPARFDRVREAPLP